MKSEKKQELTFKEQMESKYPDTYYEYQDSDWGYEDEQVYEHLFRNCIELTKDVKATWCLS